MATCVYSSEPNTYNRCDGLTCDHDAVCASSCCVSGQCDAYWCSGGIGLEVWLWAIGVLCILTLAIFMCYKARRHIKEDDKKDELRKKYLSEVLTHDIAESDEEEDGDVEKKEEYKDVGL